MASILWVEDERKIESLIRPIQKYGHNVKIVEDRKTAVETISKEIFDLIILDIIIPSGFDLRSDEINPYEGVEVLNSIKESLNKDTPIIVLSVVNDSNILRRLSKLGIQARLNKGALLPSELFACTQELLGYKNDA